MEAGGFITKKLQINLLFSLKCITFAESLQQAAASVFPDQKEGEEKKKGFYRPPPDLTPPAVQFDGARR